MFKFSAKLLKAYSWEGVDDRIHKQNQTTNSSKVWQTLEKKYHDLLTQYKIKGVELQEWVQTYGVGGMLAAREKDPVIRKGMGEILSILSKTVTPAEEGGTLRNNEITAFRNEHGANTVDWLMELGGQKRASKKAKRESALLVKK